MKIKEKFLEAIGCGPRSAASARIIVPKLEELFDPKSVADIGCGNGSFLKAFHCGTKFGYDAIYRGFIDPSTTFTQVNLEESFAPLKTVDVALCLEVAEHLNKNAAFALIQGLVKTAQIIIFSAAIPFQGGLHHVNEQWPSYWAKLFAEFDYLASDHLVKTFWNEDIAPWYHLIYIFGTQKVLRSFNLEVAKDSIDIVHPAIWNEIGLMGIAKRLKLC